MGDSVRALASSFDGPQEAGVNPKIPRHTSLPPIAAVDDTPLWT